jgi:universal stress protein A
MIRHLEEIEMFKHILVPTDLSEASLKALDIAVKMALKDPGHITLLHVIETIQDADDEEFKDFYEKLKNRAQKKMDEMADRYQGQKPDIVKEIAYGKRATKIVKFAYENDIDLIVLSSHKIETTDSAEGWLTISYKVAILSHCPVMMVK